MEASLGVPTATSFRNIPAKLLEVNRKVINGYRARSGQGKVSFTHLIGFAIVRAIADAAPNMRNGFVTGPDGEPRLVRHDTVDMGLAVDVGKILLTALIIFAVAQVSERSTLLAAVLASIPLVSVLAMVWMHHDGLELAEIAVFSREIVWLILPSLLLFVVMPLCIERGWDFYPALGAGIGATVLGYLLMLQLLARFDWVA